MKISPQAFGVGIRPTYTAQYRRRSRIRWYSTDSSGIPSGAGGWNARTKWSAHSSRKYHGTVLRYDESSCGGPLARNLGPGTRFSNARPAPRTLRSIKESAGSMANSMGDVSLPGRDTQGKDSAIGIFFLGAGRTAGGPRTAATRLRRPAG